MPRYVDVENISKLFNKKYNETKKLISDGEYHLDNLAEGFTEADRIIRNMPVADVVEVVRCKDCEYWQDKNSKGTQGICLCGEKEMNYGGEFYSFANDFCSYGKRKE